MKQKIISGAKFVQGIAQYQSSYWSELEGMFGIIVLISLAVDFYEMDQGKVEVACDGVESLQEISEEYKVTKSGSNSYDFTASAKSHMATSPLK
jgi:hypothetical protein